MLSQGVVKRLMLSRYLLRLAEDHSALSQEVAAFATINMLQASLETFLVAATDHLNAAVSPRTEFAGYLDKINEKLPQGKELPFRRRLIEINKVRVLAKHDGARPDTKELIGYVTDAKSFLEAATHAVFNVDFWTISLVSLLDEGEVKSLLISARNSLESGSYAVSLIDVRKAVFLEFESGYDIKKFESDEPLGLLSAISSAPYHARNSRYILEHVNDPFDYIVLDHAHLDAELSKLRIDHEVFWNIWRLTPEVYRHKADDQWLVKHEPKKLEEPGLKERAAYVLEVAIETILKKHVTRRSLKWINSSTRFYVTAKEDAPLYKKADVNSEVVARIPVGQPQVAVDSGTPSFAGDAFFWHVMDFAGGDEGQRASFLIGYLSEQDTVE